MRPSGENARASGDRVCPVRRSPCWGRRGSERSHSWIVPSSAPVARVLPSAAKASTGKSDGFGLLSVVRSTGCRGSATSHRPTRPSSPDVARRWPEGLKSRVADGAANVWSDDSFPDGDRRISRTRSSPAPVATRCPSGCAAAPKPRADSAEGEPPVIRGRSGSRTSRRTLCVPVPTISSGAVPANATCCASPTGRAEPSSLGAVASDTSHRRMRPVLSPSASMRPSAAKETDRVKRLGPSRVDTALPVAVSNSVTPPSSAAASSRPRGPKARAPEVGPVCRTRGREPLPSRAPTACSVCDRR
ncbi:hypothetical protein RKD26_002339 [Streptomyces calvus]